MLCFTLQWIDKEICFLSCERIPEPCYSGTVYCLAFTGKLKATIVTQFLLCILVALETAQFILKAASGASVANPQEYLCRALFTTLSHTSSGHILSMSSPFTSLQWPVLLAVAHNFLLSSYWPGAPSQLPHVLISAASFQAAHSSSATCPNIRWCAPSSGLSYCQYAKILDCLMWPQQIAELGEKSTKSVATGCHKILEELVRGMDEGDKGHGVSSLTSGDSG